MRQQQAFPSEEYYGMNLRDYFAAQASEQDIKHYEQDEGDEVTGKDTLGRDWKRPSIIYFTREQAKYRYADAMMKAREE
jgi:hypothetical protein